MQTPDWLPVRYSIPRIEGLTRFLADRYRLPGPVEVGFLRRGFNDSFAVRAGDGWRGVLRLSGWRGRGAADVATETALLGHLDAAGVPVAAPIATAEGSLFTGVPMPEGERPAVLFRHADGRAAPVESTRDARAQGMTLARIHEAAESFSGGTAAAYRLDLDHLLHRPAAAVLGLGLLDAEAATAFGALVSRLAAGVAALDGLAAVWCHGDCHGGNAHIREDGPQAGTAVFFDFDDSGHGYLAYDLAVFLWSTALQRQGLAPWHAFIEGYRSVRPIASADFAAVHLFVPIRHIWLMGNYAERIVEWGSEAVPLDWLTRQIAYIRQWEDDRLSPMLV